MGRNVLRSVRNGGESFPSRRRFISRGQKLRRFNSRTIPTIQNGRLLTRAIRTGGGLGEWVSRIQAACVREASSVLELARLMAQARRAFPRGGWTRLWESGEMPFEIRKGQMLLGIGECVEELNAHTCARLPGALHTLYCLSRLGPAMLEQLVGQGRIHPGLKLRDARALVARYVPGSSRNGSDSKFQDRLARFADFVRKNLGTWSPQEREMVAVKLAALAGEIRAASGSDANPRNSSHQTL